MPGQTRPGYDGYFNTSSECWSVFTEVTGADFSDAVLFGHVHQMTVDAYAVQHAGGSHPDKSIGIHLSGLYLAFENNVSGPYIAPILQQIAGKVKVWPHFEPPVEKVPLTIIDLALTSGLAERIDITKHWAKMVWDNWFHAQGSIARLMAAHLKEF